MIYLKICWCELENICSSKKPQNVVNECPMVVRWQDGIKDDTYIDKTQRFIQRWRNVDLFDFSLLQRLKLVNSVRALPNGNYFSILFRKCIIFEMSKNGLVPSYLFMKKKYKIQTGFFQMSFNIEYLKSP